MPGSVSESHKIGGPRNSRVREHCCIDTNNRDVARSRVCAGWAIIGEISYLRGRNPVH